VAPHHDVDGRQASQQAGRRQQGRDERVPDDGAGSGPDVGQALGAQGLKAFWVTRAAVAVRRVGRLGGRPASRGARGPRRRRQRARPPRGPRGVQVGLDPVGGALGQVAEQRRRVSTQSAQAAAGQSRLHRGAVGTWGMMGCENTHTHTHSYTHTHTCVCVDALGEHPEGQQRVEQRQQAGRRGVRGEQRGGVGHHHAVGDPDAAADGLHGHGDAQVPSGAVARQAHTLRRGA